MITSFCCTFKSFGSPIGSGTRVALDMTNWFYGTSLLQGGWELLVWDLIGMMMVHAVQASKWISTAAEIGFAMQNRCDFWMISGHFHRSTIPSNPDRVAGLERL